MSATEVGAARPAGTDADTVASTSDPSLGRGFGRLWAASTVSGLGDGILLAAVPLLVTELTRDPVLVAGATVAGQLPWLVLSLPSGALVDRWDRRRVLVIADGLRAGLAIVLAAAAVASPGLPIGILAVYGLGFLLASAETFFDPAAEALVASVVPAANLGRANGRLQGSAWLTNIFAGPAIGALLFGLAVGLPFLVVAGAFLLAAVLAASLRGSYRPISAERAPLRSEIAVGLRWLGGHALLRGLAIAAGAVNLASFGIAAMYVLYAREVLGLDGVAYGLLLSAVGVGGLVGSALAPRVVEAVGPGTTVRVGLAAGAVAAGIMSVTDQPAIAVVASTGFGTMLTFWNVVVITIRQRSVPDALRGRVMSTFRMVSWGTQPLGALLGGLVAAAISVRAVWSVAAVVYVAVAIATLRILRDVDRGPRAGS